MVSIILSPRLYFSYSQFLVYDQSVALPACLWTEKHSGQGFARRESTACFGTLLEFGYADVALELGPFNDDRAFERVIAVPFYIPSGRLAVDGPEELRASRCFEAPAGNYRLTVAQRVLGDEDEAIALFLERVDEPLQWSEVVLADDQLDFAFQLLETADIA